MSGQSNVAFAEKGINGQDLLNSPSARSDGSAGRGWSRIDGLDSPTTLPASPPLRTPPPPIAALSRTAMSGTGTQRSTTVISEPSVRVLEAPIQARKLVRKKTPPPSRLDYTSDSSAAHEVPPLPSPRQRAKRGASSVAECRVARAPRSA